MQINRDLQAEATLELVKFVMDVYSAVHLNPHIKHQFSKALMDKILDSNLFRVSDGSFDANALRRAR